MDSHLFCAKILHEPILTYCESGTNSGEICTILARFRWGRDKMTTTWQTRFFLFLSFSSERYCNFIEIYLKYASEDPIEHKSTLVQIMVYNNIGLAYDIIGMTYNNTTWRRTSDKLNLNQRWHSLLAHMCGTRSQCVNLIYPVCSPVLLLPSRVRPGPGAE